MLLISKADGVLANDKAACAYVVTATVERVLVHLVQNSFS
jgi:hypothetical protein